MSEKNILLTALIRGNFSALPALLDLIGDDDLVCMWGWITEGGQYGHRCMPSTKEFITKLLILCGYPEDIVSRENRSIFNSPFGDFMTAIDYHCCARFWAARLAMGKESIEDVLGPTLENIGK